MSLRQPEFGAAGEAPIIIVGPPEVSGRIARSVDREIVAFRTLDEFDHWRARQSEWSESILIDVEAALAEVGCTLAALPHRLRTVLTAVGDRATVPSVGEVESMWPSRRSFYRSWSETIDEPPSTFLRRTRALHAERLLAAGVPPKEAASRAGFSSADQMRKQLASYRERR